MKALDAAHKRRDHREEFVLYLVHANDFFRLGEGGYWAQGVRVDAGWLVFECDDHRANQTEIDEAVRAHEAAKPLPEGWHLLDRAAAGKAYDEAVKKWGIDWFTDGRTDGGRYDVAVQLALLGEVCFG